MLDFLSFKSFISIPALISFYYLGAVFAPFLAWLAARRLLYWVTRLLPCNVEPGSRPRYVFHLLPNRQKLLLLVGFLIMFVMMELFWRILFEYLIAFMQMRDALVNRGA